MRLRVGYQQSRFWPILARFMDYYSLFWSPVVISMINEPRGALTCRLSTLVVLSILTRFVEYYSPFWGPKAISIVVEPQGALKCRSSTIAVWAGSGPFLGLLRTILGSRSDYHDDEPRGAFT